jgi:hypothetical protein
MLFSQLPPGSDKALEMASQRGYETYILCIVLLGCIALVGMLFRWFINSFDKRSSESVAREEARVKEGVERENRLAARIDTLENFVHATLMDQVAASTRALHENTAATSALAAALERKPCLMEHDAQIELVKTIADRIKENGA